MKTKHRSNQTLGQAAAPLEKGETCTCGEGRCNLHSRFGQSKFVTDGDDAETAMIVQAFTQHQPCGGGRRIVKKFLERGP